MERLKEQVRDHEGEIDRLEDRMGKVEAADAAAAERLRMLELELATVKAELAHVKTQMGEVRMGQAELQKTVWKAGGLVSTVAILASALAKLL